MGTFFWWLLGRFVFRRLGSGRFGQDGLFGPQQASERPRALNYLARARRCPFCACLRAWSR